METILIDPTNEASPGVRATAPRLPSLAGRTVGLLDISKARGSVFLDRIEERLRTDGVKVLRFTKPTFAKIAPVDLRQKIQEQCEAVIEALAD